MNIPDIYDFDKALDKALSLAYPTRRTESVMIDRALGRIMARAVVCRKDMPSFDNSAMDGYGVRYADAGRRVDVIGQLFAGDIPACTVQPGQAVRIMTGAQVPEGVDTIVPIEKIPEVTETTVTLPATLKPGSNLRRRGEEQQRGSVLFAAGTRLEPSHIAMLSAQGITAVDVYVPLSIAVFSSGNEIREPWEESDDDTIYNANAFGITALLARYGFAAIYAGSLSDDPEATEEMINNLKRYDVVISTGGISKGDADFLYEAYTRHGMKTLFRGVNVKPGHPVTMGIMGETFVMALPGNPLAALLNLLVLSIPLLYRLQGASRCHHPFVLAENSEQFTARPGRTNLVLGDVRDGRFHVTRHNKVGSGMLTPLIESNAVAILGEARNGAHSGDILKVVLMGYDGMVKENNAINK